MAAACQGTAEEVAERLAGRVDPQDLVLLIGGVDTGKTTLARALHARLGGEVVDADLGQSAIGPPTVISLGTYAHGMRDGYFVGDTTPRGHLLPAVCGAVLMASRAKRPTLVDTDGYVAGPAGRSYKGALVELLRPDLVVLLKRDETPSFSLPRSGVEVVCVRLVGVRRKDREARARTRTHAFRKHLAQGEEVKLPWGDLRIEGSLLGMGEVIPAEEFSKLLGCQVVLARRCGDEAIAVIEGRPLSVAAAKCFLRLSSLYLVQSRDLAGLLVGCFRDGRFTGLGRVVEVDEEGLTVAVPDGVPPEALRLGSLRLSSIGEEIGRVTIP